MKHGSAALRTPRYRPFLISFITRNLDLYTQQLSPSNHTIIQYTPIMNNCYHDWEMYPSVLAFGGGIFIIALVNIVSNIAMSAIYTPLAKNHGIYLSFWIRVIVSALVIAGMYSAVGVSLVRSWFGEPFSRSVIIPQMLLGPPILAYLVLLVAVGIGSLTQLVVIGEIRLSYGYLILIWSLIPAAFVGIWGGLILSWLLRRSPLISE